MLARSVMIALLWILAGCSTTHSVSTDFDDRYDFTGKKNYALITPQAFSANNNDLLQKRIENALNTQLQSKGFIATNKDSADIWISYFATTEQQQDIRTYQRYNHFYGYARCFRCAPIPIASTTSVQVVKYTEGTLMIDIIDPQSNTLKWRGATSSRLTAAQANNLSATERTAQVNAAVNAILQKYPPNLQP